MSKKKRATLPPPAKRMSDRQALNETFERAHGEVELLQRQGAAVAYKLGERLCTIRDLELFREGGFSSFTAYLMALRGSSLRTHRRCIERYESVSAELARQLDPERIDLAARLLPHAAGREPVISERALAKLDVLVVRDGKREKVRFEDATTEELSEAVRRRSAAVRPEPSPSLRSGVARLERRLGSGVTALGAVRATRRGRNEGVTIFVPADRLAAFEKLFKP